MRKLTVLIAVLCVVAFAPPSHAFIDYLFGGSSNTDAIDNSALGDLRAWWTGNPAYQFNPYYSGGPLPGQQQGQGGAAAAGQQQYMQVPQPPASPYGQPGYGQGVPAGAQQYGAAPPGYQPAPQGYAPPPPQAYPQAAPQGYQPAPQAYQMPPQGYPQAAPQAYQAPQGYQPAPGYQMPPAEPGQQMYGGAGFVPGYGYQQ